MRLSEVLTFDGNTGEFGVNHDATAVFANDNFFVHFDFHLFLRRDAVEAATTGVTLDVNDAEAVASVFADAFESGECTLVDVWFESFCFFAEAFFFLTSFANDFVEFRFFLIEDVSAVGEFLFGVVNIGVFVVDSTMVLVDVFIGELNLEGLEIDLFFNEVVFAIVFDVVDLLVVSRDKFLARVNFLFFTGKSLLQIFDFAVKVFDASLKTGDVVFEVFYFEG
jgi:hypothetical protein